MTDSWSAIGVIPAAKSEAGIMRSVSIKVTRLSNFFTQATVLNSLATMPRATTLTYPGIIQVFLWYVSKRKTMNFTRCW